MEVAMAVVWVVGGTGVVREAVMMGVALAMVEGKVRAVRVEVLEVVCMVDVLGDAAEADKRAADGAVEEKEVKALMAVVPVMAAKVAVRVG